MRKYNSESKSMIVELYKTGRKVLDLSREYGVSEVTIYKWVNVNNLRKMISTKHNHAIYLN